MHEVSFIADSFARQVFVSILCADIIDSKNHRPSLVARDVDYIHEDEFGIEESIRDMF